MSDAGVAAVVFLSSSNTTRRPDTELASMKRRSQLS